MPLNTDLEEIPVTILRPKMPSAKYSGAPKFNATFASIGAVKNNANALNKPPNVDAIVEIASARPGEWRDIGYPSRQVAAEFAVPCVLIRIAVIEPP